MGSFAGEQRWAESLGLLREVVRQELVSRQLSELLTARNADAARVLDVGCGQGTQALTLARAGHHVTGLDVSTELLARFEQTLRDEPPEVRARVHLVEGAGEDAATLTPGPYDVLLCHGVLMYLDDVAPILQAMTAVAASGALMSLLVRNSLAPAMRDGLRGDWPDAMKAFDSKDYTNRLGLAAHGHTPQDLDAVLEPQGWRSLDWQGVRVFTDHRDEPGPPPEELAAIVEAELEAGRRDPYRQVAALLHLAYER